MNQTPSRRFTSSLSSGLSILAIFAFGYTVSGNAQSVHAVNNPPATTKSTEEKSIDIPGTFKDLPTAKDAVTAKRPVVETKRTASQSANVAQLTIDESKGVTARSPVRADVKRPAKSAPPAVIRSDTPDVAEATDGFRACAGAQERGQDRGEALCFTNGQGTGAAGRSVSYRRDG